MPKRRTVNIFLISLLLISLIVILPASFPEGLGGENKSTLSFFVIGQSQPNVVRLNYVQGGNYFNTTVTATYQNLENFEVHGTVTATLRTSNTAQPIVKTSDRITVPPNGGYAYVVFTFQGVPYQLGYAATLTPFAAEETVTKTASPTSQATSSSGPTIYKTPSNGGSFGNDSSNYDFGAIALPVSAVLIVMLCAVGSVVFIKKRGGTSEQKVRRFTSNEFQDWVLQRLNGHAGTVLDSRKGIDGYTGDNIPVSIKQSDNVERVHVDVFMNNLMQSKVKSGIMVAFEFSSEANAAVSRARMNRIDIKLVTIRELIERGNTPII